MQACTSRRSRAAVLAIASAPTGRLNETSALSAHDKLSLSLPYRVRFVTSSRQSQVTAIGAVMPSAAPGVLGWGGIVRIVLLALIGAATLHAAQARDRFEVASVRRVEIPAVTAGVPVFPPTGGIGTSSPERITYHGAWLFALIAEAFAVRPDQIIGPDWLDMERYDIVANIPAGATKEQFNLMLGNLLRDRFALRFHLEPKVRSVFALRVGKNGLKIKPAAPRTDSAASPSGSMERDARGCPIVAANYQGMVGWPSPGQQCWTARDVPLTNLARLLERPAGRPIVDETGLTAGYDFQIYFEPIPPRASQTAADVSSAPSVFVAVEEQLGLKLESAKTTRDFIIIDHVERPSEN